MNPPKGLGQRRGVAAIKVNVVAGRVGNVKPDRLSNDERDGFGFELARVTRAGTVLAVVKQFVGLCTSEHKLTYVRGSLMYASSR